MARFFKTARQQLAAKNNAAKYLRYAIGEILLVVIGILIALQVNNWNQYRLANLEEHSILKNIHSEFLENKNPYRKIFEKDMWIRTDFNVNGNRYCYSGSIKFQVKI